MLWRSVVVVAILLRDQFAWRPLCSGQFSRGQLSVFVRVTHFARPLPNFPSVEIYMHFGLLNSKMPKKILVRLRLTLVEPYFLPKMKAKNSFNVTPIVFSKSIDSVNKQTI